MKVFSLVATRGWHALRLRPVLGYTRTALNQPWKPISQFREFGSRSTRYSPEEALHAVKKRRSSLEHEGDSLQMKRDDDSVQDDFTEEGEYEEDRGKGDDVEEEKEEKEDDEDEDEGKDEEDSRLHVSHGSHMVRGKIDHGMEDYIVAENRKIDGNDLGLYAIFDGHAGRDVAEYLQSHLFDNILSQPDFWSKPERAIRRAYKETDEEILEEVVGGRGGSTAVTAILINKEKLIVANVGDSRAVICKRGTAKQLSVDHEPEKERDLVESRGGFVIKMPGNVPRVDGTLAMTRAFGDGRLKDHITSEPDIAVKTINPDTEFIILASDGIWKVMSNEDASECVKGISDAKEAAKEIVNDALTRGSYDDISCIVVMFQ